jgi:hypothetical protein
MLPTAELGAGAAALDFYGGDRWLRWMLGQRFGQC